MGEYYMISDAAKEVHVENHVLRYWEEELQLPIHRNESGHRIYTAKDVECFKQIKSMKEKGLQLKAIHTLLDKKTGDGSVIDHMDEVFEPGGMRIEVLGVREGNSASAEPEGDLQKSQITVVERRGAVVNQEPVDSEKKQRIQWLMTQLIQKSLEETMPGTLQKALGDTLEQYGRKLCTDVKEGLLKELDYQFRMQEEREEERQKELTERNEAYYARLDELMGRKKVKKKRRFV